MRAQVTRAIRKLRPGVSWNPMTARIVFSAGLGTGFGVLLYIAIYDLCTSGWHEALIDLTSIAIVSVAGAMFLEPVQEWFNNQLDDRRETAHAHTIRAERWYLRFAAIGILAAVTISHGLLHKVIENNLEHSIKMLLYASPITAAITYAWIRSARQTKARAAAWGAIAAVLAAVIVAVVSLEIEDRDTVTVGLLLKYAGLSAFQWAATAFFGGLAIDRKWGSSPVRAAGVSVIITIVVFGILGRAEWLLILEDFGRTCGWTAGLLANEAAACAAFGRPLNAAPSTGTMALEKSAIHGDSDV